MNNIIKKLFSLAIITSIVTSSHMMVVNAEGFDYTAHTNISLKSEANPYPVINSLTHPDGGKYNKNVIPLSGFIDETLFINPDEHCLWLSSKENVTEGDDAVYYPKYTHQNPPMVYIDLGAEYDISRIELWGRNGTNNVVSLSQNTRIYLTNTEPTIKNISVGETTVAGWFDSNDTTLTTLFDFGTQTGSKGNGIAIGGYVAFDLTADADDQSEYNANIAAGTKPTASYTIRKKDDEKKYRYVILTRGSSGAGTTATDLQFGDMRIYVPKTSLEESNEVSMMNRKIAVESKEYDGQEQSCFVPTYSIRNKTSNALPMVIVLATFDEHNKMVKLDYTTANPDAGEIVASDGTLYVPEVNSGKVKLFVWSGTDLSDAGAEAYSAGFEQSTLSSE